ncbi:hypothetical protein P7L87_26555 [Vibrio parahaemolyticus]|uniref:DUF1036 domain-containing protein n=1 Tax=Microvirga mediterraneensis TaxID=2754695 RepID=A0A838BTV3_9HYPH|nr:hypothetical protein [Microvirga mediterraneensis]MBA1158489.1 hypothetical protein [Microvirga mediterraneensis]MDG2571119.1 hypothetical protein [Vibrio parahaemolyticus]
MKWLAAIISCMLLSAPALAREITPAERRDEPFDATLPACADPAVLQNISSRFSHKEGRFWNSSLQLLAFERVQEVAWRPWGLDYIPRRYCTGTVIVSDGYKHRINFSIREDLGFIGIGWNTEACVDGLDRDYAYAPHCKQAAP